MSAQAKVISIADIRPATGGDDGEPVLGLLPSPHSARIYARAVGKFSAWAAHRGSITGGHWTRAMAVDYVRELAKVKSAATVNQALSAIKHSARERAERGMISMEAARSIEAVRGVRQRGVRTGNWLSAQQVRSLFAMADARDRAVLALFIGCGLRRAELSRLRWAQLVQREGEWVLADVRGKGNRVRTVPVPPFVKEFMDAWREEQGRGEKGAGSRAHLAHREERERVVSISESGLWHVVREYGIRIDVPDLAPHDLRRTFAKLSRKAGADLEQIQLTLGHAALNTTERYLGGRLEIGRNSAGRKVNDFLNGERE